MQNPISSKRVMIDKANARMIIFIGVASFLTVFSLVSMKALVSQMNYQNRVIGAKKKAVDQLKENVTNANDLVAAYKTFDAEPSILGNSDTNAKIVLDALPSKYDFPALGSSLEKILTQGGYKIDSINGIDDEKNQNKTTPSSSPKPVEIPFSIKAGANYTLVQKIVADFERSIRPFKIGTLTLSGNDADIKVEIDANSYYQPERTLDIKTKVVK
jgi:hypothetical protein